MGGDGSRVRIPTQSTGRRGLTIRLRILGSFLLLALFILLGHLFLVDRSLEDDLIRLQEDELRRELELTRDLLPGEDRFSPDSLLRTLSSHTEYSLTLLRRDGEVVAVSPDLSPRLRGLSLPLDRLEIQAALAGETGFDWREDSGGRRLYGAVPLLWDSTGLILQASAPLRGIDDLPRTRSYRLVLLGLGLLLSLFLAEFSSRAIATPLRSLTRRARAMSNGESPGLDSTGEWIRELQEFREAFDEMAETMTERTRTLESERNGAQALIDYMGEGVLSLTGDGRILRANEAAVALLGIPRPHAPAHVRTLGTNPALRSLLEQAVDGPFSSKEFFLGGRNLLVSARRAEGGGAVVTFVDVTEVRRVEEVRRDFVANASHELKTPLTAIRGFAETLLEDDPPEEVRKKWLASIRSNALRLQRLVEDLLDLSRLESGGWVARRETMDLGSLCEVVFEDLSTVAGERGVTLSLSGEALVVADKQGLEQVVKNLLENSIRYSPDGEVITVQIQESTAFARVAVSDLGPGIPKWALPRIFERFFRVDPARSRRDGGTGLGLAIVRHLVGAMGGEVWAESELGSGTTVYFTLPLAKRVS